MKNVNVITKLSLTVNLLLIAGIIYLGAESRELIMKLDESDCRCKEYSTAPPYNFIGKDLLRQMAGNYQATRNFQNTLPPTDPRYPSDDAGSVWFALEDIKRFIWEIESRMGECKCQDIADLGIRIYYARYPEASTFKSSRNLKDLPKSYGLMHTVFMVPTIDKTVDDVTGHFDFDVFNSTNCTPEFSMGDSVIVMLASGKNHGTLCPPICGTTEVAFGQ